MVTFSQANEVVVLPNCGGSIKCEGKNKTTVSPVECKENEECGVKKDGKRGCVCKEGFMLNEETKECEGNKRKTP